LNVREPNRQSKGILVAHNSYEVSKFLFDTLAEAEVRSTVNQARRLRDESILCEIGKRHIDAEIRLLGNSRRDPLMAALVGLSLRL
jgi:hypothetical protein